MKKLTTAAAIWLVLLALVVLAIASIALAEDCTGTTQYCGSWANTCCTRGCTGITWEYQTEQIQCFELMVPVGMMQYPAACRKYKQTALYYSCPDELPACTRTWWWLEIWGFCD